MLNPQQPPLYSAYSPEVLFDPVFEAMARDSRLSAGALLAAVAYCTRLEQIEPQGAGWRAFTPRGPEGGYRALALGEVLAAAWREMQAAGAAQAADSLGGEDSQPDAAPARQAARPSVEQLLADPAASRWLKQSLASAITRDPVDAAADAAAMADALERRADEIAEREIARLRQERAGAEDMR